jgi:1-deoxy-D-xylulose-5-phosphate synthase
MIFEELGFKYVGPINGHNIEQVVKAVSLAKQIKKPVLIHVLTQKGKGYKLAEEQPDKFHGTAAFKVETGEPCKEASCPTYTQVFGETLVELAKDDEKIVAITAAMPSGTGLNIFRQAFPERVYDVGIAEQHAVTFAAGLAVGGLLPVVAIYSTFLQRAFDQVIEDVALQNLHVIFALDRGGLVGEDGPTHHGTFDLSYLRAIPNMIVMAPKDENELRHMLYTATQLSFPVAIRYPRGAGWAEKREPMKLIELGRAEVLKSGKEVCLIAVGRMVQIALEASEALGRRGIYPTVVNARFVKPLDEELLRRLIDQHRLFVTLEDNALIGGFGEGVGEWLAKNSWPVHFLPLGLPDRFIEHGSVAELFKSLSLDAQSVARRIEKKLAQISGGANNHRFSLWLNRLGILKSKERG